MAKNELAPMEGGAALASEGESRFVALRPDSDMAEAMKWNSQGAGFSMADLIRVPTPAGGATTWSFMNARGEEETTKEIVGALVMYVPQLIVWPSEEPEAGRSPVIISHDLKVGYRVSEDIGDLDESVLEAARVGDREYDMERLAYCQYGSGRGGRGRRAKEARLMAILRPDDMLPLLISAGPGSIKSVNPFVKRISGLGVPYFQTVVGLRLEKVLNGGGQPYAQIVPRLVETLSRPEGVVIRDTYTVPLLNAVKDVRTNVGSESADD